MRRALAIASVVIAAVATSCGGGGDETTDQAACDGLEAWVRQVQDVADRGIGEGFGEGVEEMQRLDAEWQAKAPERIRDLAEELDSIDSDTLKIEEQERREAILDDLTSWARDECGLDMTF